MNANEVTRPEAESAVARMINAARPAHRYGRGFRTGAFAGHLAAAFADAGLSVEQVEAIERHVCQAFRCERKAAG